MSLQAATEQVTDSSAATAVAATATATADATGIAGTWTVDTSVGELSYEDSTGTFVGFRIDEELSGLGSTTASAARPTSAAR